MSDNAYYVKIYHTEGKEQNLKRLAKQKENLENQTWN